MDLIRINIKRQQSLQLREAVLRYDLEAAKSLIEGGADVDYVNPVTKHSILDTAVRMGQKDMVVLLLNHGAQPNPGNGSSTKSLLSSAVAIRSLHLTLDVYRKISREDHMDVLVSLLDHGALTNSNRVSVFNAVLRFGCCDTVTLFARHGLDLDRCKVPFPLHEAAKNQRQEVMYDLLERDYLFDIDALNESGSTALHLAASAGNDASLRQLLVCGADPNLLNRDGESALDVAIKGENYAEVEVLLNFGARTSKSSILKMADKSCNKKIVESVLRRMILMEALGQRLFNDEDEQIMRESEWISGSYVRCSSELRLMREYPFCGPITFYDVLLDRRFFDTPNRVLVGEMKKSLVCFVEEFLPDFRRTIGHRVYQIEHRFECISRAKAALEQILGLDADTFHVIHSNIVSHLGWRDLYHLHKFNCKPYVGDATL